MAAYAIGRSAGAGAGGATLVLAGVTVAAFFTAVQTFVQQQHSDTLQEVYSWILGRLPSSGWHDVVILLPYVAVAITGILLHRRLLDVLSVGDEEAASLGVNVGRVRLAVVVCATVGTAAAVAVSGLIGFVGIIVPHAIRLVAGPSYRLLLPLSVLVGGGFLVLADVIARTALSPARAPDRRRDGVLRSAVLRDRAPHLETDGFLVNARRASRGLARAGERPCARRAPANRAPRLGCQRRPASPLPNQRHTLGTDLSRARHVGRGGEKLCPNRAGAPMSALALERVTVKLGGRNVVDGVSFAVEPGDWVTLIGPNGAGKTTLLRAIAGLVGHRGEIRLDGDPLHALRRREVARRVALVPQSPLMPAGMTRRGVRPARPDAVHLVRRPRGAGRSRRGRVGDGPARPDRARRAGSWARSPAASGSGRCSRARSHRRRRCSCSTSRRARSTPGASRRRSSWSTACVWTQG